MKLILFLVSLVGTYLIGLMLSAIILVDIFNIENDIVILSTGALLSIGIGNYITKPIIKKYLI